MRKSRTLPVLFTAVVLGVMLFPLTVLAEEMQDGRTGQIRVETKEDRMVREIGKQLRCAVCQNEPVSDSNSELAVNMRNLIREQLRQGKNEDEIMAFFVSRYGDYVLMKPRREGVNWILWAGPFVLLIGGLVALVLRARNGTEPGAGAPGGPADPAEQKTKPSDDLIRALRGEQKGKED